MLFEYLTFLVENGLIEYEGGQTYRTTEKGMRLLYLQNKIDEVAPISFIKE
jgi:predicted transcriptional regulator